MSNLCVIPARGGSKRIPRKNIKDFLGKPIIAYSIQAAIESGLFEEIMVSTDDEEIAAVAERYGAKIPFMRSASNSDDFATLANVIDEVLERYRRSNKIFEYACCILPTAPLISTAIIKQGLTELIKNEADSVRPVVRFEYPIQRAVKSVGGRMEFFWPEYRTARSQDLDVAYHDAGLFYWMRTTAGLKGGNRFVFEIPEINCQDIDTETDWQLAEMKYKILKG